MIILDDKLFYNLFGFVFVKGFEMGDSRLLKTCCSYELAGVKFKNSKVLIWCNVDSIVLFVANIVNVRI